MNMQGITGSAAAFAIAALMSGGAAQAAMSSAFHNDTSLVQRVDCVAGVHVGPVGGCILGAEHHHHDKVIERHTTDEGCRTKTVHRSDDMGNSETHTKTNCD